MLKGDEHFVIVKLISGEQVMAILGYEGDETVDLIYPMLIRTYPIVNQHESHEHVTAAPYSQFAEDAELRINKRNIIFIKNLHHMLIPHFKRLVDEHGNKVLVQRQPDGSVQRQEELSWEEAEEELREECETLSTEELHKRIAMLEAIFGAEKLEERVKDEAKEEPKTFIEGNDTIH